MFNMMNKLAEWKIEMDQVSDKQARIEGFIYATALVLGVGITTLIMM